MLRSLLNDHTANIAIGAGAVAAGVLGAAYLLAVFVAGNVVLWRAIVALVEKA